MKDGHLDTWINKMIWIMKLIVDYRTIHILEDNIPIEFY
jgi:hypothetical protein